MSQSESRIRVEHDEERQTIRVHSPYDAAFVSRCRALGGKWDRSARAWVFDEAAEEAVRVALRDIYGTDGAEWDEAAQPVTLYLLADGDAYEDRGPVCAAGTALTLARAFGRDSGAVLGEGVAHLDGPKPRSGGSRKNWTTEIPDGCLLAVYNVPRAIADRVLLDARFLSTTGEPTERAQDVRARLEAAARADH